MGADISRIRLDPLLDFSTVGLKQGGVLLDADFNEGAAVTDRRLRAAASDILGRSTVSSTTPDAFKIALVPMPVDLLIGVGRLYVDGLLAECHRARSVDPANKRFDPLLGEAYFAEPVSYGAQPYLPKPPQLPTAGRHLVYLDVFDREVTHHQMPSLVEVAVGVEASWRTQTVWQVRVLSDDAGDSSCGTPDDVLPGWADLIAPSTGRITTGTFDAPPEPDPCELPPSGGFRGLENQTYRFEIHDPGQPGVAATFKWSRENASVASRVSSMVSSTELELDSLGRDDVLRFNTDDWVEILDDAREFSLLPGEMRKITVNEAARRITFATPLPADMIPLGLFPDSDFPKVGNLRVRRWDQKHKILKVDVGNTTSVWQDLDAAGSTGVIRMPAAGTTLLVEHGLTVSFSSTGLKGFRAGDYFVCAARSADASVEPLVNEPPRGIHHHYERLAMWDVVPGTVTDCRHPWPRGCCTEVVYPGESIQDAINRLPLAGGCVCLKVGVHEILKPLRIERSNVTLHGETVGAVVRSRGIEEALLIGDPKDSMLTDIRVEEIRFEMETPKAGGGVIQISKLDGGAVRECQIEVSSEKQLPLSTAIRLRESSAIEVVGNRMMRVLIGVLADSCEGITISENLIRSVVLEKKSFGMLGIGLGTESTTPSASLNFIERNDIADCCTGIYLGPGSGPTRISSNAIKREPVAAGITKPPLKATTAIGGLSGNPRWWAIDVRAPGCTIADNQIALRDGNHGGILFTAGQSLIERNDIRSNLEEGAVLPALGIVGLALGHTIVEHSALRGNRLDGVQGAIMVVAEPGAVVDGLEIVENRISSQFLAHADLSKKVAADFTTLSGMLGSLGTRLLTEFGIWADRADRLVVLRNQIDSTVSGFLGGGLTNPLISSNCIHHCAHGVLLDACVNSETSDNLLHDLVFWGILSGWGTATAYRGNRVANCSGYGLFVVGGTEHRITGGEMTEVGLGVLTSSLIQLIDDVIISDARHGGIVGLLLPGRIGMSRNRLERCGVDPKPLLAAGLAVLGALGQVEIDGCEIRDTGASKFAGPRFDVLVYLSQSARLRGCTVGGEPMEKPDPASHAIAALTIPWSGDPSFADLLDNDAATSGLVIVDCIAFRGEAMCSTNRVVNRSQRVSTTPTFRALGTVITATGNRVLAPKGFRSLALFASNALSAVGNITTDGASPVAPLQLPNPYVSFNVST